MCQLCFDFITSEGLKTKANLSVQVQLRTED